jgi:hypothetical protein
MNEQVHCMHCGRLFAANPRIKNQRYCSSKDCQRARKRAWQKEKLATDPDYKSNQLDCQREWHRRHPQYYQLYRKRNGNGVERNRLLQRVRDSRRRRPRFLAKMDALKPAPRLALGQFHLLPVLAKMDASAQKVILIPVAYKGRACLQKRTR